MPAWALLYGKARGTLLPWPERTRRGHAVMRTGSLLPLPRCHLVKKAKGEKPWKSKHLPERSSIPKISFYRKEIDLPVMGGFFLHLQKNKAPSIRKMR